MNILNEIVVSIENDKNQNAFQQSISEENTYKEKIYDESQLTFLLYHFYENLKKSLFKKTITEIDSILKEQNIDGLKRAWKVYILRIRAQLKVIRKKIDKYLIFNSDKMRLKYEINSIKKYLSQVLENLIVYVQKFSESQEDEVFEKTDNLLCCYFEYIYLYCLYNKKMGNIIEIISYLPFIIKLYNETKLILKSERTLSYLEKCFILLCQILICNEDYILAKDYIDTTVNICLYHLIFNIEDISDGVLIGDRKEQDAKINKKDNLILTIKERENEKEGNKNIKKIIFHLIILFYYRGINYENIGKINFSIKSYYQCLWFYNNFLYHSSQKILYLFNNTLESSIELKNHLDFVKRRIEYYDKIQFFLKKQIEKKDKEKEDNKDIMYQNLLNGAKYQEFEKKILNLKIKEVDTTNRFDAKKNIKESNGRKREGIYRTIFMSDTRLLNSYLREDFRQIVDNMDKIKILDLDLDTREKIQKFLHGIYFEQSLKKLRQKNEDKNYNINIKNTSNITNLNKLIPSSIAFQKENKNKILIKNNSMPETLFSIKKDNKKKDIKYIMPKQIKKRKLTISNTTFRLTRPQTSNNCSKVFTPTYVNKAYRPISSLSGKKQISYDEQKITRVFKPVSTSRNFFKYKSKTLMSSNEEKINKSKYTSQELYNLNKNYKRIRAQSARAIKRIPTEDKNLNKFFNKDYLRKRNYIQLLEDRDLKFQKCILKIKKDQKTKDEIYTKDTMKKNADKLFKRVMGTYLIIPSYDDRMKNTDKESKLKEQLQKALVNSLDNAAIIKYNIQKDKERNKRKPMTEQMNLLIKDVNKINNNTIKDINNKIEEIKQREIIENKIFLNKNNKFIKLKLDNVFDKKFKGGNPSSNSIENNEIFNFENKNKEHYFYNSKKKQ